VIKTSRNIKKQVRDLTKAAEQTGLLADGTFQQAQKSRTQKLPLNSMNILSLVRWFNVTTVGESTMTAKMQWYDADDTGDWANLGTADFTIYPHPEASISDYDTGKLVAVYVGTRWYAASLPSEVSAIRWAFVDGDVATDTTQDCFLDVDTTGDEITVTCTICGGSKLSEAVPRLSDGTRIPIIKDGETWRCLWGFQATEDCD